LAEMDAWRESPADDHLPDLFGDLPRLRARLRRHASARRCRLLRW
jgi:hypothetical protein